MNQDSESMLRAALRLRNPELLKIVEGIVSRVSPLLWRTVATFPTGTSHTPEHTLRVEFNAGMLMPNPLVGQLSNDEIAILILGCHFHDLGMAGTEAENLSPETREQARRDHSFRIGDRIKKEWQTLGIPNQAFADALSEVCRGHRPKKVDGIANWDDIRETALIAQGRAVRLRLVSALLYAADELHISADRAPVFEQQWVKLQDEESRRHWKRHQCVEGPVLIGSHICFDVRTSTFVQEKDLKSNSLKKAFSAIRDAQKQLKLQEISVELPSPKVSWLRDDLWRLCSLKVLSDMRPRSLDELTKAIYELYSKESEEVDGYKEVCCELPDSEESIQATIRHAAEAFKEQAYLVPSSDGQEGFTLDISIHSSHEFSRIAHSADETDVLLAGRFASHHEFDFLRTAYGKAFAERSLMPLVLNYFGVDLNDDLQEVAVRTILGRSPTAARLVIDFPPAPRILVKRHLLRVSTLTGASLDLLRCPELMLDKEFRLAIRALSATVSTTQGTLLQFIEELVLVDGYDFNQVTDALSLSEEGLEDNKKRVSAKRSKGAKLTENLTALQITQTIPLSVRPSSVSFAHLVVAGQRSHTDVEFISAVEAPLTIRKTGEEAPTEDGGPARILIGQGGPTLPGEISCRAQLNVDQQSRSINLDVQKMGAFSDPQLPLIVRFNVGDLTRGTTTSTMSFSYYTPALTASHLTGLLKLKHMVRRGPLRVTMTGGIAAAAAGESLLGEKEVASWYLSDGISQRTVDFLCNMAPNTPFPWYYKDKVRDVLDGSDKSAKVRLYKKYLAMSSTDKPSVHTVVLRYANVEGVQYHEEFLGFVWQKTFGPPKPNTMTKEEFEKWLEDGRQDAMLSMSFGPDMFAIAKDIREWAEDPNQPFPLKISGKAPESPIFKTRFDMVWCAKVDRLWYVERPLIMRVRPIREDEQWNVEGMYWESIGDHDRAEILRERLQSLASPPTMAEVDGSGI